MSAVAGDTLARTHDCKTAGCPNEARSRVGRHAYCDYCQKQRAERRDTEQQRGAGTGHGSYEQRAKQATKGLIKAGRRVDRAATGAQHAAGELRAAKAAWEAAIRLLVEGVQG